MAAGRGIVSRLPLVVLAIAGCGVLMQIPALHALILRDHAVARAFFYFGLLVTGFAVLLALASTNRDTHQTQSLSRGLLPMLASIYAAVSAAAALPVAEAFQISLVDAWFEMVSCFTTTGASVFDAPRRIPPTIHLWRGMIGWLGGLFILVSALVFFAPMLLGGYGLLRSEARLPSFSSKNALIDLASAASSLFGQTHTERFLAGLWLVFPWYAAATFALWLLLVVQGVPGFSALMLAMAALSTSGILPRESLGAIGVGPEVTLALAMALALSRVLLVPDSKAEARLRARLRALWSAHRNPEVRLATVLIGGVVLLVVARHAIGAFDLGEGEDLPGLGFTAWGAAFTAVSFLSTTGFVAHEWIVARSVSGLTPPGLVLMGLVLIGGGVATTAGGVKLLRVYVLARLGQVELARLVHPHLVAPVRATEAVLSDRAIRAAWLFAMVFAIVAVVILGVLLLLGRSLEEGLIFMVAALTTTGPLVEVAGDSPLSWAGLGTLEKLVLAGAMILGRLEILVILALLLAQVARR